jgi:hypothetical protein
MRAVPVALLIGALLGLSGATAKSTAGHTVHACVAKSGGAVRFIKHGGCKKSESTVLIDQKGPRGKAGKTGRIGQTGLAGGLGATGPVGPTGPAGPANSEVVLGPTETLAGSDNSGDPTGEIAVSTAVCSAATNPANVEAYGGGVNIVTSPQTSVKDVVSVQSSYPGNANSAGGGTGTTGVTGPLATPVPQGNSANAWSGVAVVNLLKDETAPPDTATVQTYVVCGP